MVATGAVVSTDQPRAASATTSPLELSSAWTSNMCGPSASPR